MPIQQKVFLVGANGHAKVVIDLIEKQNVYTVAYLFDTNPALHKTNFFGYPVVGSELEMFDKPEYCELRAGIVAIGDNRIRTRVAAWLLERSVQLVTAIHPAAQIGRDSVFGAGTVIMAGAVVNPATRIGDNVILNTRSSIDHDCCIGDSVHIAPGATLCGGVVVGDRSFVCAGATVLPGVSIGCDCTIGAGAVVTRNVPDGATVVGVPARKLETR